MLYQRPTFTCPAASSNTTQINWDAAFLAKKQFLAKYPALTTWYNEVIEAQ